MYSKPTSVGNISHDEGEGGKSTEKGNGDNSAMVEEEEDRGRNTRATMRHDSPVAVEGRRARTWEGQNGD